MIYLSNLGQHPHLPREVLELPRGVAHRIDNREKKRYPYFLASLKKVRRFQIFFPPRYCSAGGFFIFLRIASFVVDSRTFIEMNQIIGVSFHFSRWRLCPLARIFYICRVLLF